MKNAPLRQPKQRAWSGGSTDELTWDAAGRLLRVSRRDGAGNGFDEESVYDPLGRRVRVVDTPYSNGAAETTDAWFDPLVEFEEVAVRQTAGSGGSGVQWEVRGPDENGAYGGLQGVGGLEAVIDTGALKVSAVWSDMLGHVEAYSLPAAYGATPGVVTAQSRSSGYGLLPGEAAVPRWSQTRAAGTTASLAASLAWQGRRMDAAGYYWVGARMYNPQAGRFLSPDPLGQAASWDLYSYAGGDPINNCDCTGRGVQDMQKLQPGLTIRPTAEQIVADPSLQGTPYTLPNNGLPLAAQDSSLTWSETLSAFFSGAGQGAEDYFKGIAEAPGQIASSVASGYEDLGGLVRDTVNGSLESDLGTMITHPLVTAQATGEVGEQMVSSMAQQLSTSRGIGNFVGQTFLLGGLSGGLGGVGGGTGIVPISMDEALEQVQAHVGPVNQVMTSSSGGIQFISTTVDSTGNTITKIGRLDINPASPHVQNLGPHLNLETQINGRTITSGPLADPHTPIDPATIRPGDY